MGRLDLGLNDTFPDKKGCVAGNFLFILYKDLVVTSNTQINALKHSKSISFHHMSSLKYHCQWQEYVCMKYRQKRLQ